MANTTTPSSSTSNIIIYNVSTNSSRIINFYDAFSGSIYGYYRSITMYNNNLYIGTYIGGWTTSTSGYIFVYKTSENLLQLYSSNPNGCPVALCVSHDNALLSINLVAPSTIVYFNIFTPINTFSGFYIKKYNESTYDVDSNI